MRRPCGPILLAVSATLALAAGEPAIVLDEPVEGQPFLGQLTVAFHVTGVPPAEIASASVLVDGRTVASLAAPPAGATWKATIDAGDDETRPRRLEILARLRSGRELRFHKVFEATGLVTQVHVRLVNLAVTVTGEDGRPVTDLRREDFQVLDQGQPVAVTRWTPPPAPLAVALVLDVSYSMKEGERLLSAQRAAEAFLRALRDDDQAMVLAFNDEIEVVSPMAAQRDAALKAVRGLTAGGGTALYDAIFRTAALQQDSPVGARRVAIVLSDGRDEAASGLEVGSFHTLDEAIRQAHEKDVVLFTVGLGSRLESETDFSGRITTAKVLERLAESTGGRFHGARRSSSLPAAFRDVLDELRHQYDLAYPPPPAAPGESWRSVEVRVRRPGVVVRTREGYFVR
ncbi:MAG: VWA domain-containing protein [Acidobacteria bacterium]|nr:VWA domain-containing protein [Acidobacteriota bacterium]